MMIDNQSLIILSVGLALNISIVLGSDMAIVTGLIGVLGGIYVGKKTEKIREDNPLEEGVDGSDGGIGAGQ